jgi:hypothetical protein
MTKELRGSFKNADAALFELGCAIDYEVAQLQRTPGVLLRPGASYLWQRVEVMRATLREVRDESAALPSEFWLPTQPRKA